MKGWKLGRRLYDGWLAIAAPFGEVQTLVLVGVIYLFALGPLATGMVAARRDLLSKRGFGEPDSAWMPADTVSRPDLERAKRQF